MYFVPIQAAIQSKLDTNTDGSMAHAMINIAYRCASTYRATNYRGGCSGSRIRFPPNSKWLSSTGTDKSLSILAPITMQFQDAS